MWTAPARSCGRRIASEPAALIGWFASLGLDLARIGLEAGPLSQWLYAAMKEAGLAVELLETRHVRIALKTMPVKTDRNDARGIAQLMRLGWFRPVYCKSMAAQETRALLTALYEAANVILTRPVKGGGLNSWAMKLAKRAGMKKAKVALARKLGVILHRMWIDGTPFDARRAACPAPTAA